MKIQELAIIFIIIILPISLLLSEYTQFEIKTINLQTEYDTKLTDATYDSIKAFQINAQNETYSDMKNKRVKNIEASVNAFRNSIMSGFKLNGYTEDELNNYIPALLYTLYDGFYIYSPYKNIVDENGSILEDASDQESLYGLKPYISYSCRYKNGSTDVVITYALDNYITVQGTLYEEGKLKYVNKSGYLIDNIDVRGDEVTYNGVTIENEQLKENFLGEERNYAKINGRKYYLIEGDETQKDCIVYNSNGSIVVAYKEGTTQFDSYKDMILKNDSAQQYYKDAYEFKNWLEGTSLTSLKYSNAIDEVIADEDTIITAPIWPDNDTKIFGDTVNNIENELSNFNQHRLAVIRHKIETNLAIAISNYNTYSGATSNVFQMPELKETEWYNLMNNISLISFLQGLPIGGKIYNGYSLVTNSESTEVVLEENIYILGNDANYHKIGDRGFEDGSIKVDAGDYVGDANNNNEEKITSAGRLNLDFKRSILINNDNTLSSYYYPLEKYNASYDSIVMQKNVTVYDDIYAYVNAQEDDLKKAFYTALGRERHSAYKKENIITD